VTNDEHVTQGGREIWVVYCKKQMEHWNTDAGRHHEHVTHDEHVTQGGVCFPCAAGTYATAAGSVNCSACPAGSASPFSSRTDPDTCAPCPPGTFCR
jgi:hypothetical protein